MADGAKLNERKLITLPPGYHFVGHEPHMHEGKFSKKVKVEYVGQSRRDMYKDLYILISGESRSPACLCFCGKTLNIQKNKTGRTVII